jgi:DNA polymerase-3 subunit alpha
MHLTLDVGSIEAIRELALLLPRQEDAKGEVIARLRTGTGEARACDWAAISSSTPT